VRATAWAFCADYAVHHFVKERQPAMFHPAKRAH
jgi:hypothetical protein